jgi:NAD(P)-dependent dehydrogenase (short-subunit alcohol dehydrogenase family)
MVSIGRALVVGGTSGIGKGIALALAKRRYEIIVAGRSETRGQEIVEELRQNYPGADGNSSHHRFLFVDAFDLNSVKSLAKNAIQETTTKNNGGRIDLLVMTQGMATLQGYTPTQANGIDQKLQLQYFSRIYLAALLAPHMKPGSRILTVLSAGIHKRYAHEADDFELQNHYSIQNAADAAGYYTDAGFQTLSIQYPDLVIVHAAPGFVNTSWGTEMPWMLREFVIRPTQWIAGTSLETCGETMTTGLLSSDMGPGFHLLNQKGQIIQPNDDTAAKTEVRERIWEKTWKLLPSISG